MVVLICKACIPLFLLTVRIFYLVFLFQIPAVLTFGTGIGPNIIDSISLQASLNGREKFDLDIAINLKNYLPSSVQDKLEKNLESTLRVYIRALDLQGLLDVAGNDHYIDKTDIESEFRMELRPLRSHKPVTYWVSVNNLWADQNYSLYIDTWAIDELPGAKDVTVHFRSV